MTASPDESGYWYLHVNGTRIFKPKAVVAFIGPDIYFEGPFCKQWWQGRRGDNRTPEERLQQDAD